MPSAPRPANEPQRLAALNALSILDTPAEEVFDSFVRVACGLFDVPIAAVSLVAEDRQWFKAARGFGDTTGTPRDHAFCAYTILDPDGTLLVPDAALDSRFRDNPLVTGNLGIRFYAGAPLVDGDGFALGSLCVIDQKPRTPTPAQMAQLRDIATGVSAALRLHGALRHLNDQAHSDPLTGLNNRRAFDKASAEPAAPGLALMLLDLDGFKGINDTLGHPAGDLVLHEVALRISAAVRQGDAVYRLGGDEFALLLQGMSERHLLQSFADRLHAVLAEPFAVDEQVLEISVSVGAAVLPDHAASIASLVSRADGALYRAKRAGRGLTRIASTSGDVVSTVLRAEPGSRPHSLKSRLKQALVPPGVEPFTLVFQPVVSLVDRQVHTLEALVRWSPEPGDNVSPTEFVPLAEQTGLAPLLDRWVLRTACATAATWPRSRGVSVNVSAVTLGSVDVPGMVREILAETGLDAKQLTLELTETALADDPARAVRHVDALRTLGVGVALDDFGAGHASLVALRDYAFTKLKIDRAIVSNIHRSPVQRRAVRFVTDLGRMLGLTVVAEGMERPEELDTLHACEVNECQGYLFAKPAATAAVERAVRSAVQVAWTELRHDLPEQSAAD